MGHEYFRKKLKIYHRISQDYIMETIHDMNTIVIHENTPRKIPLQ